MKIKSTAETLLYPLTDILQVRFEVRSTEIGQVKDADFIFRFSNGQLKAERIGSFIGCDCLFFVRGCSTQRTADQGGWMILDVGTLNPGVYVVKAGNVTYS